MKAKRSHKRKRNPAKAPGSAGRPAFKPTQELRRKVEVLVCAGASQRVICSVVSHPGGRTRDGKSVAEVKLTLFTLRKYFRQELEIGLEKTVATMRMMLIGKASAGDVAALLHVNRIFGWNERLIVENVGPVDPASLTDGKIAARIAELQRSTAARNRKSGEALH